jgi:phosphinothricin acetyltransferase
MIESRTTSPSSRRATPGDASAIAAIYNEGIDDRVATFETRHRTPADIEAWFDDVHPVVVVELNGEVAGFASTSTYRPRDCYAGIAEYSVYVARSARGHGGGRTAPLARFAAAGARGYWKPVARLSP